MDDDSICILVAFILQDNLFVHYDWRKRQHLSFEKHAKFVGCLGNLQDVAICEACAGLALVDAASKGFCVAEQ